MSKTKAKVALNDGEAYVIQDTETWEYIANTFVALGNEYPEDSDERDGWNFLAEDILAQSSAHNNAPSFDDEW